MLIKVRAWFWDHRKMLLSLVIFLAITIIYSYSKIIPTAKFESFNGTYQNYNVVRRLLDGQHPYRDFIVYLGLGHLYFGALATFLFGNNYAVSIVAYTFLTVLSFSFISFALGAGRKKSWSKTIDITGLILVFILIRPLSLVNLLGIDETFIYSWGAAIDSGLSARMVRAMILPISILLSRIIYESKQKEQFKFGGIGVIVGCSIPFSNDYGIATAVSIVVFGVLLILTDSGTIKSKVHVLFCGGLGIIIGLLTVVRSTTGITFIDWILTIKDQGSFQGWYYNQPKVYYIYEIKTDFFTNIQGLIALYCMIEIFRKQYDRKNFTIGILNLAAWFVIQEAALFSTGGGLEIARNILWLTIVWWAIDFIEMIIMKPYFHQKKKREYIRMTVISLLIAFIVHSSFERLIQYRKPSSQESTSITSILGAKLTSNEKDVEDAKDYIGNEKVFSTYASALEDVCGFYQPSGYDYIIHVLGEKAREKYINSFQKGEFRYVGIQKTTNTPCEYWIRNANWFFYKELYKTYQPVYTNQYLTLYEKGDAEELADLPEDTKYSIEKPDNRTVQIKVETDEKITGVADIMIDYEVVTDKSLSSKLVFRKDVFVSEVSENELEGDKETDWYRNYYLPGAGRCSIPITIVNGEGIVRIYANPENDTFLNLKSVTGIGYYASPLEYFEIERVKGNKLYINNTPRNKSLIDSNMLVDIENEMYEIQTIYSDKTSLVCVLDRDVNFKEKVYFCRIYMEE